MNDPAPIETVRDRSRRLLIWLPAPAIRVSLWLHAGGTASLAADPSCWPGVLGVLAANHAILACGMHPRSRFLGPNVTRLPPAAAESAMVALTFDDGPDPAVTPRVLDMLDSVGAKASFFVIGRRAARHGDLLREMLRRGHSIENHTYRHPLTFACWSPAAMLREIDAAQRAIADACGQEPWFFRPPAGLRSPLLDPVLAIAGLSLVSWTRRGYDGVGNQPAAVLRRLTCGLAAGDLLVLHDGRAVGGDCGQRAALSVLPSLLARFDDLGLRAASLRQALGERPAACGAGPQGAAPSRAPAAYASM